jgi:hypothetical protein
LVGPPIQLVASRTNILPDGLYTVDQPIRLAFDRFLDPVSVDRQSIWLENSFGDVATDPLIAYDPVTLTVAISNPGAGLPWLVAGEQYRVVLGVASPDGGAGFGIRAIDGATLTSPIEIEFTAGAAPSPAYAGPPTMRFCEDILAPVLLRSCALAGCHTAARGPVDAGEPSPILGLDLQTAQGVRLTAIGQVADEANTGPLSTTEAPLIGSPFAMDMPVVTAGSPGLSWLVYKVLLATPEPGDAETTAGDGGGSSYGQGAPSPISTAERARLANVILGQAMPYPNPARPEPGPSTLTEADLERVSLWIAQGAATPSSCR